MAKSSWFNRSAQRMNDEEEDVPWNESRKSTSEEAVCTYQPEGRRQEEGKEKTRKKSLAQPSSRKNTPVWEAAMFVPATGGSLLRKTLQKLDNQFAALHKEPGVKMVEQGGTMLSSILTKADPWGGAPCGREECFPCSSAGEGKGGKCYRENVLYKLVCTECSKNRVTAEYVGESSRSANQRAKEHLQGLRRNDPRNPIVSHNAEYHPELHASQQGDRAPVEPGFTMEVLRGFTTPLASVAIEYMDTDIIMNSKGEWGEQGSQE